MIRKIKIKYVKVTQSQQGGKYALIHQSFRSRDKTLRGRTGSSRAISM